MKNKPQTNVCDDDVWNSVVQESLSPSTSWLPEKRSQRILRKIEINWSRKRYETLVVTNHHPSQLSLSESKQCPTTAGGIQTKHTYLSEWIVLLPRRQINARHWCIMVIHHSVQTLAKQHNACMKVCNYNQNETVSKSRLSITCCQWLNKRYF